MDEVMKGYFRYLRKLPEGLDMHVRGQSREYREPGAGRQGAHSVRDYE